MFDSKTMNKLKNPAEWEIHTFIFIFLKRLNILNELITKIKK